ncbi:MAG: hypothetical protein ACOVNU_10255 [Candidatus Kapaibacteriota bacterium]
MIYINLFMNVLYFHNIVVYTTFWYNQYQITDLFLTDRTSFGRHIKNNYSSIELDENSTCKNCTISKLGSKSSK